MRLPNKHGLCGVMQVSIRPRRDAAHHGPQRGGSPMASEATLNTHYLGKVLPNGHIEIPQTVVESMGLQDGDEVVVALHKVTAAEIAVPAEVQMLMQELV